MNEHQRWVQANNDYLADAIAWLHQLLERQIAELTHAAPPAKRGWFKCREPETEQGSDDAETAIRALGKKLAAAESADPPPALIILSRQLGLDRFEQQILLLCAAIELDGKTAALCAKAQDNPYKPNPTFALALRLFEQPNWQALSADRPLRYWRLLEINQPGAEALTTSALRADERIVNFLVEPRHNIDDRLLPFMAPLLGASDAAALAPSQRRVVGEIAAYLQSRASGLSQCVLVQLAGPSTRAKTEVVRLALAELGLGGMATSLENLPTQTADLENLLRLWERERLLLPVALYLDAGHADEHTHAALLRRLLGACNGVLILGVRDPQPEFDGLIVEIAKPDAEEQQHAWREALGDDAAVLAAQLAGQFSLELPSIREIADSVAGEPAAGERRDRLWQACLRKTSPKLDQLARRIDVKAAWSDIVLPKEPLALLNQIAGQIERRGLVYNDWGFVDKMNRGLGLSVLFAGESGTGKTMAAEVIANALQLNLYRIDLSAVVSKYIGETEKNLRRLFDAAEDGGAILFFDEADALFGKRSEVKDSHDRYANIEINYLLQRMEAYRGLAILATNMKSALDQAFMRRLRFIVNFPFPGAAERADMWRKVFPPQTPLAQLDYQHLARFNLTGGSIHNVALNAAFLAAASDARQVTMALIFEALRAEFRKLDKPVNEAEFRLLGVVGSAP